VSRSDTPETDEPAGTDTEAGTTPDAISLAGHDLEVGYPSTDEPIVECERVLLPAGEVTALVGPNGSGKSTLLKALSGQLEPWAGGVELDGEDVYEMAEKRRARRLGLLSQERESPSSLTVEELVLHGRYPHRGFLESVTEADHEAVERAIDLAGVEHLRERELGNLSGGQKQLAWIAMTLAQETDVLLLDEPTTFLDLRHQLGVLETVRQLNRERGVTVGVVLHDISQAARFADNLVALRDGTPYDWGPPDEVVTEDLLADVFGVDASVGPGPEGPTIRPHRALDESDESDE
jgi:iron complex transport system ATP-binding protein